jgi:hypothetical protein
MLNKGLIYTAFLCLLVLVSPIAADTDVKLLGDESDGSRAVPVHLVPLLDEDDKKITPDDEPLMPFSARRTCGSCHSYDKISAGWHFNAGGPTLSPGRVGQPWILVDKAAATQIPLSYRPWPGAFNPKQVGLTTWKFVQLFGRQMPGGVGELDSENPEEVIRGFVSGKLEVNCLTCHNAHPGQDQAQYAIQIARQNFRWAATAASEFASVSGSAKKMSDTYDPQMPEMLDDPKLVPPTVTYRKNTFDHKNQVFFDIVRKVPTKRCYFCHSNIDLDSREIEKWSSDEDVHLASGMTCIDCHRHGLDHNITRGYEREELVSTNPLAAVLSCKGCHLQDESSTVPTAGRLGAPVPEHRGIPPVHFDKLTCTACHSGAWPKQKTYHTKTARAHGLGTFTVNKSDDALPHIIYPVFAKQQAIGNGYAGTELIMLMSDSKIGPQKLIWPAFWGSLKDQKVTPIDLETVKQTAGKIIAQQKPPPSGDWPSLTGEHITQALSLLEKSIEGKAVYISGGKLHHLDDKGNLIATEHSAASPYLWPIAHDVRPAAQSLGIRGCKDCHTTDAPFFFGEVVVDSPLVSEKDSVEKMVEFQNIDPVYMKAFAISFVFRPWLKVVALASCAVLAGVLLLFALKALACITKILVGKD